jgi:hypothetical protein
MGADGFDVVDAGAAWAETSSPHTTQR